MKIKERIDDYEYFSIIQDLLGKQTVQDLDNYVHHHFQSRLDHSIAVSYYGYRIGKHLGLNYEAMARAGLLHDLFHYDWRTTKFKEGTHAYVHPRIALINAKAITDISPLEEDIIVHHMAGATKDVPQSKEAWVITMIDKYLAMSEISRSLYFKMFKNKIPYRLASDLAEIEVKAKRLVREKELKSIDDFTSHSVTNPRLAIREKLPTKELTQVGKTQVNKKAKKRKI